MGKTMIRGLMFSVAGLLVTPLAGAAETGFYVGGFYGNAEKDEESAGLVGLADQIYADVGYVPNSFASTTFDNKSKGYGFFGGYRLFQHLAVEGGYMMLGTVDYRERSSGTVEGLTANGPQLFPTDAALNLDSEVGGLAVSVLGVLPLTYNAEVYGRAGAMFSTHKLTLYYADVLGPGRNEVSESDVDVLAGVGAAYTLAEVYALRAEYIRVFDAGDSGFGEADVDLITIGITVRF
jgi:hypothetical protein